MSFDQRVEGADQGFAIQFTPQPHRVGNVILGGRALEAVQQPETGLGEGDGLRLVGSGFGNDGVRGAGSVGAASEILPQKLAALL